MSKPDLPRLRALEGGRSADERGARVALAADPTVPLGHPDDPTVADTSGEMPFTRRRTRWVLGAGAALVVLALIGALFVLPVRAWMGQREAIDEAERQLDVIWAENKRLADQYDELQTAADIERVAREEYGLARPGEETLSILPDPAVGVLPSGWPHGLVEQIIALRSSSPVAPMAPAATASPLP